MSHPQAVTFEQILSTILNNAALKSRLESLQSEKSSLIQFLCEQSDAFTPEQWSDALNRLSPGEDSPELSDDALEEVAGGAGTTRSEGSVWLKEQIQRLTEMGEATRRKE